MSKMRKHVQSMLHQYRKTSKFWLGYEDTQDGALVTCRGIDCSEGAKHFEPQHVKPACSTSNVVPTDL